MNAQACVRHKLEPLGVLPLVGGEVRLYRCEVCGGVFNPSLADCLLAYEQRVYDEMYGSMTSNTLRGIATDVGPLKVFGIPVYMDPTLKPGGVRVAIDPASGEDWTGHLVWRSADPEVVL